MLAAGLRLYQARESLWLDELHTSWAASGDLSEVAHRARIGNQSPPYFYLVWSMSGLFGQSELVLRLPSLVAGTLLVPLLYGLVFGWTNSRGAALLAALLAAVDRDLIYFAQEARPYALVQLVALVQVSAFWKLTATASGPVKEAGKFLASRQFTTRMVFSLCTALLVGLHYTAALLVLAELVYFVLLAWRGKGQTTYYWYDLAFDLVLAVALCLPIWPHLREVYARRGLWRQFVDAYPSWSMLRAAGVYLALPLVCLGAIGALRRLAGRTPSLARADGRAVALLSCWLFIPVALAWVSTWFDLAHLFFPRYLVAATIALPAAAGLALAKLPGRVLQGLFAVSLLAVSLGTSGMLEQLRYDGRLHNERDEDWRAAAAYISESTADKAMPVFLLANLIEDQLLFHSPDEVLLDYCRFPLSGLYRLDHDDRRIIPMPGDLSEADLEAIMKARGEWVVIRGSLETAQRYGVNLEAEFKRQFPDAISPPRMTPWKSFGELHVAQYLFDPPR